MGADGGEQCLSCRLPDRGALVHTQLPLLNVQTHPQGIKGRNVVSLCRFLRRVQLALYSLSVLVEKIRYIPLQKNNHLTSVLLNIILSCKIVDSDGLRDI